MGYSIVLRPVAAAGFASDDCKALPDFSIPIKPTPLHHNNAFMPIFGCEIGEFCHCESN